MSETTEQSAPALRKRNVLRRLYDWVLHWADTKWGTGALFLLAFAESSFFPIPPDILLIALCLGKVKNSFRYALVCTAGSILGAAVGYLIGHFAWLDGNGEFTLSQISSSETSRASRWKCTSKCRVCSRSTASGWCSQPDSRPYPTS